MKIFIGQAVTGEDRERLKEECIKITGILKEKGHESICIIDYPEDVQKLPKKEKFVNYCFNNADKCDVFLAIIRNDKKSEGMLMELGHILDKNKKIILLIKENITNTYLREIADDVLEYENYDDMFIKLNGLEI